MADFVPPDLLQAALLKLAEQVPAVIAFGGVFGGVCHYALTMIREHLQGVARSLQQLAESNTVHGVLVGRILDGVEDAKTGIGELKVLLVKEGKHGNTTDT